MLTRPQNELAITNPKNTAKSKPLKRPLLTLICYGETENDPNLLNENINWTV